MPEKVNCFIDSPFFVRKNFDISVVLRDTIIKGKMYIVIELPELLLKWWS